MNLEMPTTFHVSLIRSVLGAMAVAPMVRRKRRVRRKHGDSQLVAPAWAADRLGYWPLHDRGGSMSDFQTREPPGILGALARIELNEEDEKKSLLDGVPTHLRQRD